MYRVVKCAACEQIVPLPDNNNLPIARCPNCKYANPNPNYQHRIKWIGSPVAFIADVASIIRIMRKDKIRRWDILSASGIAAMMLLLLFLVNPYGTEWMRDIESIAFAGFLLAAVLAFLSFFARRDSNPSGIQFGLCLAWMVAVMGFVAIIYLGYGSSTGNIR